MRLPGFGPKLSRTEEVWVLRLLLRGPRVVELDHDAVRRLVGRGIAHLVALGRSKNGCVPVRMIALSPIVERLLDRRWLSVGGRRVAMLDEVEVKL